MSAMLNIVRVTLLVACLLVLYPANTTAQYAEPINHGGFYLGPRVGIPFILGFRGRYVAANDERPFLYVDGDLATSVFINSSSVGAGCYPIGDVLYVGGKYHAVSLTLADDPSKTTRSVYSVEVGASIALSKRKNWLLLIDAGPIINPFATTKVLPNITLSIVGRLF